MHVLLHLIQTLVVAAYAVLAAMFLMVGRLAASQGVWDIIDHLALMALWTLSWGGAAFALVFAGIALAGCVARWRCAAAWTLLVLGLAILGILLFYRASPIQAGELLFLLPCLAATLGSAWQAWSCRAVVRGEPG